MAIKIMKKICGGSWRFVKDVAVWVMLDAAHHREALKGIWKSCVADNKRQLAETRKALRKIWKGRPY